MLCTSSTCSGPDSYHTAQEGSIGCLRINSRLYRERIDRAEEVTSRAILQAGSTGHLSSGCRSLGVQPVSDEVSRRWSLAADSSQRKLSRAPICVFSRRAAGLRGVPVNMLPAHKRFCATKPSIQHTSTITLARQESASAILDNDGESLPAAEEQDCDTPCNGTPASSEDGEGAPGLQENPKQPAKISGPLLNRLEAGASSPPIKAKAFVQESGLQTKAGHSPAAERPAISRRRLSFFAQLQRPQQVQPPPSSSKRRREACEEGTMQQQSATQEQRQVRHQFKQAYLHAQLAEQWAAGQTWAELDATGVPWSSEAAATAEHRWRKISASIGGGQAVNWKDEAERAWDALRTIRMRHCSFRMDFGGAAAIKGILKPAATGHEGTAGPKRKLCKVRIQDGS